MAVISVTVTDAAPEMTKWEMPPEFLSLPSPIPRGILTFKGTSEIAILGTGDQTAYRLVVTFPSGFAYLPRMLELRFQADDLTNDFDNNGWGQWSGPRFLTQGTGPGFNLTSPGETISAGTNANRFWEPTPNTPKLFQLFPDTLSLRVNDMSADASSAGDLSYWCEFYVFDVDQIDKFAVNTPIPVISHTSF